MNNVHLVTQEKYRVKQGQNRLSAPSAQPIGPAAHPGRAQAAQSTVLRACRAPCAARLQRVPACRAPLPRACPASACRARLAPQRPTPRLLAAPPPPPPPPPSRHASYACAPRPRAPMSPAPCLRVARPVPSPALSSIG